MERRFINAIFAVGLVACGHANSPATGSFTSPDGGHGTDAIVGNSEAGDGSGRDGAAPGQDGDGEVLGPLNPLDPTQLPPPDPNAQVVPNLDSAIINIDPVEGAKDYRAFVIEDGVEVLTDSEDREVVNGATIFCAGQRQRAAPRPPQAEVLNKIEVTGLTTKKTFVVEAIDRLCPFTGLLGHTDATLNVAASDLDPALRGAVPVVSEATTRARYGSMIFNGHGPASRIAQPAEPSPPKVLKRWTVEVAPIDADAAAARRTRDFFADFAENDQPVWVEGGTNGDGTFHAPANYGFSLAAYQNKQFAFYATNTELAGRNHVFLDRGRLRMLNPDINQAVMGTVMAVPKKAAHLEDDTYLHVTFEVSANSTVRRYWWFSLCGPEQAGQTFAADGLLKEWIILGAGFFNSDGLNPSTVGWNCLFVFPHDGLGARVPGNGTSNPESSVIVDIHRAGATELRSGVNVSPQQVNEGYPRAWYRLQKGGAVTNTGVLDELLYPAPNTHFDLYISRSRIVMYVNGEQRICNDFGPERLSMAEGAVGFNSALYHSSAEHSELQADFADRRGQLYYLQNTVFADMLAYDNVGFEEGVGLPADYSGADCYVHAP